MHGDLPDTYGHRMGPLSLDVSEDHQLVCAGCYFGLRFMSSCLWFQLNNPLRAIDRIIGQLMDGLKQMKLHRCVNIILVGDHGTDTDRVKADQTEKETSKSVKRFIV